MTTATETHWSEVLGNDVDALQVMRLYHADAEHSNLADWIEAQSVELWGDDHVDHDWQAMAAQIEREALHGDYTFEDVSNGLAQVVSCPECGQMEIWGVAEIADHGQCRCSGKPCAICG